MRKYAQYIKEKYNRELIEVEDGFIDYEKYDDGSIYIYTLYVVPEKRSKGIGKELEDMMIEKENPVAIFCDVDKYSDNWIESLVILVRMSGCKLYQETEDKVVLYKEL